MRWREGGDSVTDLCISALAYELGVSLEAFAPVGPDRVSGGRWVRGAQVSIVIPGSAPAHHMNGSFHVR